METSTTVLTGALDSVQSAIVAYAGALGPKIGLAAIAGIGLGVVGFGIRYIWKLFKGSAK